MTATADLREPLTDVEIRFAEALLLEPNPTRAYILAGGTARGGSATSQAWKMVRRDDVARYLAALRAEREVRTGIEADAIVMGWWEVYSRCMQSEPVLDADGEPTGEYRFNANGATNALDKLAKHFGLYEKDNKQKAQPLTEAEIEAVKAKLRERGIDLDRARQRSPN